MIYSRKRTLRRIFIPRLNRISIVSMLVVASLLSGCGGAFASWWGKSTSGSVAHVNAASIGTQSAPTVVGSGGEVVVSWSAATLGSSTVKSYTVMRYSGSTAQAVTGACAGAVVNIGCVELNVPAGTWTYTVTPVLSGTSWVGVESSASAPVTTSGVSSGNSLWLWVTP